MMEQQPLTAADVGAVMRANGGYGYGSYPMPVMPMYPAMNYGGGFGGGYGFGGDFLSILLLFALFGGGFGGLGGFGGFGGGLGLADGGLLGYAIGNNATKGDLSSGLQNVQNGSKLDNLSTQIGTGFANTSTQLCNGFADVQNSICNGVNTINTGLLTGFGNTNLNACQNTNAITNAISDSKFSALQSANNIQAQLAQNGFATQECCCDIKTAIANSDNLNFRNTCAIENMIQAQTTTMKEENEKTRALITANKIEELERQLAQKDRELLNARFDASQIAQTAQIKAGQVAEVDALYDRLSQCPVPTTPVYGRTPIFTCNNGWNNGCGCGSQFVA